MRKIHLKYVPIFYYECDGRFPWICVAKKPNTAILAAEEKTVWGEEKQKSTNVCGQTIARRDES